MQVQRARSSSTKSHVRRRLQSPPPPPAPRTMTAKLHKLQCLRIGERYLDVDEPTGQLIIVKDAPADGRFSFKDYNKALLYGDGEHSVLDNDEHVHVELTRRNSRCRLHTGSKPKAYMDEDLWFQVSKEEAAICDLLLPQSSEEEKQPITPPPSSRKRKSKKPTKPVGRMAKSAKESLNDKVDEMEFQILKNARLLASHASRKTITKADMEQAARLCRF